jgi:drug/metabolite transporter (DMT)-like permease
MKRYGHLTLKIFSLIVLNDILDGIAQLLMKVGLSQTGIANVTSDNIAEFAFRNAASPFVMAGLFIGLLNYFLWFVILYRIDLSIALPVGSTIYIFVPVMSIIFLHEEIGLLRWTGILLIIIGIHLVSRGRRVPEGAL